MTVRLYWEQAVVDVAATVSSPMNPDVALFAEHSNGKQRTASRQWLGVARHPPYRAGAMEFFTRMASLDTGWLLRQ